MLLSFRDRYLNEGRKEGRQEGREEGREEGRGEGVTMLAELIKKGLSLEDALQKIQEETSLQFN